MVRRLILLSFLCFAVLAILGCEDRLIEPKIEGWQKGQSEFVSASRSGNKGFSEDSTMDTGTGNNEKNNDSGSNRTIEEGDIVRVVNKTLFILNYYRGLQIVSLEDLDSPKVISSVPIYGTPIEMYIRDNRVYVVCLLYTS
ncbi:MAG: hypothetical protein N2746_04480, partial [Deltaproteobacteria bacterium]|nr:hypothetical protein [Deltaproteobacteria bacterium]